MKESLSGPEKATLIAFGLIVIYHVLTSVNGWMVQLVGEDYQESKMPNYYDALREQDLEELVEEE